MELKQLQYYIAVVESGSISAGARRLHISQPPLSTQMKALEDELGVQLFIRDRKQLILTDAGKHLYERAKTIIDLSRHAAEETTGLGRIHTLRIGLTATTMPVMVPWLSAAYRRDEGLRLEIHEFDTYTLLDLLRQRIIDTALVRTPASLEGFDRLDVRTEAMYAASVSPLPDPCTLASLPGPLIIYRRYEELLKNRFSALGTEPLIFAECTDARTAAALCREGCGTAVFPGSALTYAEGLYTAPVDDPLLRTEIVLVWRSQEKTPLIGELVSLITGNV